MENRYIGLYQSQSTILGPRSTSMMGEFVVRGGLDNLRSHLLRIKGGDDGQYLNSQSKSVLSKLVLLQGQEKDLQSQWERFCKSRIQIGEARPRVWPTHLKELKDRLSAKIIVAEEEIAWLEEEIKNAEAGKAARQRTSVNPRHWGAGRLHNNVLIEFCGWQVRPDKSGLLRISDPTSPYNTMPIWQVKSQVVNPLHFEYRLRVRKEESSAQAENRKRKEVPFPKPPVFDPALGNIEYPADYHAETLRKIKIEDEI